MPNSVIPDDRSVCMCMYNRGQTREALAKSRCLPASCNAVSLSLRGVLIVGAEDARESLMVDVGAHRIWRCPPLTRYPCHCTLAQGSAIPGSRFLPDRICRANPAIFRGVRWLRDSDAPALCEIALLSLTTPEAPSFSGSSPRLRLCECFSSVLLLPTFLHYSHPPHCDPAFLLVYQTYASGRECIRHILFLKPCQEQDLV